MKTTSNPSYRSVSGLCLGLLLQLLCVFSVQAQDEIQKAGFVRLVNAVGPGSGKLTLLVDGGDVNPDGYKIGDVTGGIGLKPGSHELKFRREGIDEGSTKVNVVHGETTIMIPFGEKIPASDEKPAHWVIRILRLKQKDVEKGRSATFVSVSSQPELQVELKEPEGSWTKIFVKRLATAQAVINYPEGYAPIKTAQGDLDAIPIGNEGNYVVVLYDDENSKVHSVNFKDLKYLSAD